MASQQLAPGAVFAGEYRVERLLAQGGMGAVYVATQRSTGRQRALKLLHPRWVADQKIRARFVQEALVGAAIDSPHVVEVVAAGVDDATGVPWLAMELLKGETLAQRLARSPGGMPPQEAWWMLSQLTDALVAAHAKNVVHRDLKTENVFLEAVPFGEAPFTVKVLDFGIARVVDPRNSSNNATAAIGTPLWMAPEQNTSSEITPAADVWAVGLLAFSAYTGRYYWLAANERELRMAPLLSELVTEPLPPASTRAAALGVAERLPPGFDAFFAGCVARDPAHRFANAMVMRERLRDALDPTRARPFARPPSGYESTAPAPPPPHASMMAAMPPTEAMPAHRSFAPEPAPSIAYASPSQRRRALWVLAVIALLGLVAAGAYVAWMAVEDDPPPPPRTSAPATPSLAHPPKPPPVIAPPIVQPPAPTPLPTQAPTVTPPPVQISPIEPPYDELPHRGRRRFPRGDFDER